MRTKDFETAIDALCVTGLIIDEMVLEHNQVKKVYAHTTDAFFQWDAFGRGYTCLLSVTDSYDPLPTTPTDRRANDSLFNRDPAYDLRFR